jgi:hypothetical protein
MGAFSDNKCGYGTPGPHFGLVEIKDEDVGTFVNLKEIASVAFWCERY